MVRAWKIGELEKQDANNKNRVGPPAEEFKKSSFVKRMMTWRKV
jgi:hypothetical protein